jgi:hypothetical protein
MKKKILILLVVCLEVLSITILRAQVQRDQIFDKEIKTVEVKLMGTSYSRPVMLLDGEDVLSVSFDELSHEIKNFSYKIEHCNADWTLSSLSEFEYLEGINTNDITDYQTSVNTTFNYTHYAFSFPNEYVKPKISGNYILTVFRNNNPSQPCFKARFSIVDRKIEVNATVKDNTDLGLKTKYQQVDFDLLTKNYFVSDPFSEITVCIRQNGRTDNEVTGIKPTLLGTNKLSYVSNKATIFEGGNEYRSLEISNIRMLDEFVREIKYVDPYYHVEMEGEMPRNTRSYAFTNDANGNFVVNLQRNNFDVNIEADYLFVHFSLPYEAPFFDGGVYLVGNFNFQQLDNQSQMHYVNNSAAYEQTLLLKQGGYNYLYLFLPKGTTKATTERTEGSFWQTENEYEILVYHRPLNGRYDRLVGYQLLKSNAR